MSPPDIPPLGTARCGTDSHRRRHQNPFWYKIVSSACWAVCIPFRPPLPVLVREDFDGLILDNKTQLVADRDVRSMLVDQIEGITSTHSGWVRSPPSTNIHILLKTRGSATFGAGSPPFGLVDRTWITFCPAPLPLSQIAPSLIFGPSSTRKSLISRRVSQPKTIDFGVWDIPRRCKPLR